MIYTEKKFNGSMVTEDEVSELKEIAEKYDMDYVIATHDCFSLLPRKVCTICITRWTAWDKFDNDEELMARTAQGALQRAQNFCDAHPNYRITDVRATSFDVEQVND